MVGKIIHSQVDDVSLIPLSRYKQEILRLRKLMGSGDPMKVGTTPPAKP